MARNKVIVLLLVVFAMIGSSTFALDDGNEIADAPIVETSSARIRGRRVVIDHPQLWPDHRGSLVAYRGIPYAEPPVGDRRYARPVAKTLAGDFDASSDEVIACMQYKMPMMYEEGDTSILQEDCLLLDVYVPEPKPESAAVMVWIHGGGFHFGTKSHPKSNPMPLVALNDVIVVAINYRLGLLGFLSSGDDEIPGNLGLLDQREALLWVQQNIAAFGGDPARVTIFGESAGSASVNSLILSPMCDGLFSRAILQSGASTPTWTFKTREVIKTFTFEFGKAMGCEVNTSRELVTCLRGKSADDINQLLEGGMTQMLYMVAPVADGVFLPEDVMKAQADGIINRVDVMIGCNEEEGNIFAMPVMLGKEGYDKVAVNRSEFRDVLTMSIQVTDPLTKDIIELVYEDPQQLTDPAADLIDPLCQFSGDRILLCPTFDTAKDFASAGLTVYAYLLTHQPAFSIWGRNYSTWLGATHGEDMPYVFGSPFLQYDVDGDDDWFMYGRFADDELAVSHQMMTYWTNFAKTGDPNTGTVDGGSVESPFPAWPRFTSTQPVYKDLSRTMENREGALPNAKECYFQLNILPKLMENQAEIARLKSLLGENVDTDSEKSCDDPTNCPDK